METMLRHIRRTVGRRGIAVAAAALAAVAVLGATPQLLGGHVAAALGSLDDARPGWLWLAGTGFALSMVAAAGSWREAVGLCGGRIRLRDAAARYGAGSLVNTFVPARAGDAVRLALFSRTLDDHDRLWRTGGAFAALGAARAVALAGLVVAGALLGALPLWPLLALATLVAVAAAVAAAARRREAASRAAHVLDAFRTLGREPRAGLRLVGWVALSVAARVLAAAAIGTALGIRHPFLAALLIVPALEIAGIMPLTPGNVGIASGAVAVAFRAHGIPFTHGLAAGIALHGVETAVGISFGLASAVWLAPYRTPGARRLALLGAGAAASLVVVAALGATVLVTLA